MYVHELTETKTYAVWCECKSSRKYGTYKSVLDSWQNRLQKIAEEIKEEEKEACQCWKCRRKGKKEFSQELYRQKVLALVPYMKKYFSPYTPYLQSVGIESILIASLDEQERNNKDA